MKKNIAKKEIHQKNSSNVLPTIKFSWLFFIFLVGIVYLPFMGSSLFQNSLGYNDIHFILIVLGSLSIISIVNANLDRSDWSFWAGLVFAINAGIFSLIFSAHAGLTALLAITLYFLNKSDRGEGDWKFWVFVGVMGTLYSPVLIPAMGLCALFFWFCMGELRARLYKKTKFFLAISTALVPYMLALLFDFNRDAPLIPNANWGSIVPAFTYYLFPWTFIALVAYGDGVIRFTRYCLICVKEKKRKFWQFPQQSRLIVLGLSIFPLMGLWGSLPLMAGLILIIVALWSTCSEKFSKYYTSSLVLTAIALLLFAVGLTVVIDHFKPLPLWWSNWTLPFFWVGVVLTAKGFWNEATRFHLSRPMAIAKRSIWLFLGVGILLMDLGQRDKKRVTETFFSPDKEQALTYYDPSKQGQKNKALRGKITFFRIPVRTLQTQNELAQSIRQGDRIVVSGEEDLNRLKVFARQHYPSLTHKENRWQEWSGEFPWRDAWQKQSLAPLEKNYYMVQFYGTTP